MIEHEIREVLEEHHLFCCGGDYCDWKTPAPYDTLKDNPHEKNEEHCFSALLKIFEKYRLSELQKECHAIAKSKGGWNTERNDGEDIALMNSKLPLLLMLVLKTKILKSRHWVSCSVGSQALYLPIRIRIQFNRSKTSQQLQQQ